MLNWRGCAWSPSRHAQTIRVRSWRERMGGVRVRVPAEGRMVRTRARMLTAWQIMTAKSPQPSILPSGLLPACLLLCLPACLHCLHAFVPALHACVNVKVDIGGSGWQQRRRLGKVVARLKKPISSLHPRNMLTQTTHAHTHHHHHHHHVWKCSHVHKHRTQLRVCMHVRAEGRSQRKAQVPNERTRAQVAPGRRFRPAVQPPPATRESRSRQSLHQQNIPRGLPNHRHPPAAAVDAPAAGTGAGGVIPLADAAGLLELCGL